MDGVTFSHLANKWEGWKHTVRNRYINIKKVKQTGLKIIVKIFCEKINSFFKSRKHWLIDFSVDMVRKMGAQEKNTLSILVVFNNLQKAQVITMSNWIRSPLTYYNRKGRILRYFKLCHSIVLIHTYINLDIIQFLSG